MNDYFLFQESTTVRDVLDFFGKHYPDFHVQVNDKEYQNADPGKIASQLFVFRRELPLKVHKGREFDETFLQFLSSTGLNMSYTYLKKHPVKDYSLEKDTTLEQIRSLFKTHFPLYDVEFYKESVKLQGNVTLFEAEVEPFVFTIYDQFASTKNHFMADTHLDVLY